MNVYFRRGLGWISCAAATLFLFAAYASAASDEGRVTRIVRDVRLLPSNAKPRAATINDKVKDGTGVRTGDQSRSELTFVDLTIERLGANTFFSFDNAGRKVELESGSMLLRVPKDSGGAQMNTRAVTVGITGTTVILEATKAGRSKLTALEGGARISLIKYPRESVYIRGGQMEDVPPGATKLPPPQNVDLNDIMNNNPLVKDFGPLPSRDLIYANMGNPPSTGQPGGSGPSIIPSIIGNVLGGGPFVGPGQTHVGTGHPTGGRTVKSHGTRGTPGTTGTTNATGTRTTNASGGQKTPTSAVGRGSQSKPTPTPTPRHKQGS